MRVVDNEIRMAWLEIEALMEDLLRRRLKEVYPDSTKEDANTLVREYQSARQCDFDSPFPDTHDPRTYSFGEYGLIGLLNRLRLVSVADELDRTTRRSY